MILLFCLAEGNNNSFYSTFLDIVPHNILLYIVKNFIGYIFLFRYTEARKDREKFRKRLVEVIMHRDEWDDEDAEPGTN